MALLGVKGLIQVLVSKQSTIKYDTIFIDMIALEWPPMLHKLAYFSSRDPCNTHGYLAEYLYALIQVSDHSVMRSCPKGSVQSSLFVPPTSRQQRKPLSCCNSLHVQTLFSPVS